MAITILSNREFNQDAGKAKMSARHGSAVNTDPGCPLTGESASLVELLAMPDADAVELEPARVDTFCRPAELDFNF